jgi:protein gp37
MLELVTLPRDFLELGDRAWVIVGGEQDVGNGFREMDPAWARALRDQCAAAGVPFLLHQMADRQEIPADLFVRQFPRWKR